MTKYEQATFGAGCFWGVEESFIHLKGVKSTEVGFMGGITKHPTYQEVCGGNTGHAEVVHIEYDPIEISYEDLLHVFWSIHDPTQLDRQGPDVGRQYRSVIFYHTPEQERLARQSKADLERSGKFHQPIVTEIIPAGTFWPAEEYHQEYYHKTGHAPCRA